VRQDRCDWCCPECGSHKVKPRGRVWRQWRLLPIGRKMAQDECMVFIMRTREKAQEFLALANKNSVVQASTTTP
jgi:hypothetical protein